MTPSGIALRVYMHAWGIVVSRREQLL